MKKKNFLFGAVLIGTVGLAIPTGLSLLAQEGDGPTIPPEPALGVLASSGHRIPTVTFLKALTVPHPRKERGPKGGLSLFIPGPEQLYYYGNKNGVVTFLKNLPRGAATIQVLVRDVKRLEAIADKASTLEFLRALNSRGGALDIMIVDIGSLARLGKKASLITFARNLPARTVVHLYATPREMTIFGADADLLGFIGMLPCPVEIHLDDPMLEVLLRRWESRAKKKDYPK